jgi:hypothetical protein
MTHCRQDQLNKVQVVDSDIVAGFPHGDCDIVTQVTKKGEST